MAKVTVIPASRNQFTSMPINERPKRKVAGYARVSTDLEEQQSSYETQLSYYTSYIRSNPAWEFAGMYSDEGISGTSTARREGFNRMIEDALAGRIDLIITKSVSRFARNTVDSLTIIRKLKEKGVEVFFEKENIYTLDSKGELLLTIMSSLAQEESRSISENTKWGKRKQFAEGKGASIPFTHFLGYDRGPNGEFVINEEQAETVRLIYELFLSGKSPYWISKELTRRGIKTPYGKEKWLQETVVSILTNEKYKGDVLFQKDYVTDFLTHKRARNNGEIPQYYAEDHHEAIIPSDVFDMAQEEMQKRQKIPGVCSKLFSGKIRCAHCGGYFGSKVWHSTDKYRRIVFVCNNRYKDGIRCKSSRLYLEEVEDAFVRAFNTILDDKEELIDNLKLTIQMLSDTAEMENQRAALENELHDLAAQAEQLVADNSRTAIDAETYHAMYDRLSARFDEARSEYEDVSLAIAGSPTRRLRLTAFVKDIEMQDPVDGFDERLWSSLVEYMTVYEKDDVGVTFKDGTEIRV